MQLDKQNTKKILLIAAFVILFYWILQNIQQFTLAINYIIGLLAPIIVGLSMAFIINIPMRAIENTFFSKLKQPKFRGFKRIVSLCLTIIFVIAIIMAVLFIVIPEIANTLTSIGTSIPTFLTAAQGWLDTLTQYYPELGEQLNISINWAELGRNTFEFLQKGASIFIGSTFSAVTSVFSGILTTVLGFVLALYVLLQKETLCRQFKKIAYAYFAEYKVDQGLRVLGIVNRAFSNFFTGQCLEAVILGFMFFVSMRLLGFPHALMISVTIGFTALVPIVGSFIGCFVGAFLILVINPIQAMWFVVLFLVMQQIEGNLIYPRVVGSSVGLSGIWVLIAVTLGGSLMGVLGMLIMVPLFSVIYTLLKESANERLKVKNISKAKVE